MIVIPRGIGFIEWTNSLYTDLPNLNLPLATSEIDWKDWAETMLLENQLVNVPLPKDFTDWRNWAEFFINNV